jgi:TPR repeat protein/DNA-binding XRE family transcriptional regulator
MTLHICDNIKRLRAERGITQEKLALEMGVTTRAVSKWECGKTYPDITLLPGLASFFGVTIDELIQMDAIRDKQRADALKMQVVTAMSQGKLEENITLLRETIKEFPGDYWFQVVLANHLLMFQAYLRGQPEEPEFLKTNCREAAEIYEHVLKHCADDPLRLTARLEVFYAYQFLGETEKAKEMYGKLPLLEQTSLLVFPDYLTLDERMAALQGAIKKLVSAFRAAAVLLADVENKPRGLKLSIAERIKIIEKANSLYALVYEDGDYGYASNDLQVNYAAMAWLEANDGNKELTIDYLEKSVDFAVMSSTRTETLDANALAVIPHTSLLVNKSPDLKITNWKTNEHNACWNFLHISLENDAYTKLISLVGDTDRYKAVIAKLEKYENAQPTSLSVLEGWKLKAENGDADAMFSLGNAYDDGENGAPTDYTEANKWYRMAADKNHTAACNNLGVAYLWGRGVKQDYAEALRLFQKSDEVPNPYGVGNPWARENIGRLYREGLGVEQSYEEAVKWYELAAELKFPLAQYRLGEMYEEGLGVARDLAKAAVYYEKAANPDPVFDDFTYDLSPDAAKKALKRVRANIKQQDNNENIT